MIVIGMISGTSVECIEVAACEILGSPPALHAEVLMSLSIPWPHDLRKMVLEASRPGLVDIADLCLLDVAIGEAFAAAALEAIAAAGYYPEQIDLIGMQGQMIRHEVQPDGHVMASLHLGQAAIVAEWTGLTTISQFRQRDIAAGGQGAPLIGYVDWLLLRDDRRYRAVQYLDSISSVVFVPPKSERTAEPLAFDIGPGTVFIDYAETWLSSQSESVESGHAEVNEQLLVDLMVNPYLKRRPPKTVGQSLFSATHAAEIWERAVNAGIAPVSILETFVAFAVNSIVDAFAEFSPGKIDEVILAGKGRHYPYLTRRLREALNNVAVLSHEDIGMESDSKHALGAAVLAYETWHNRPGTHPSLTGVQHSTPLGNVTLGRNYDRLLNKTWQY